MLVKPFLQHAAQGGEPLEPVGGLQNNLKCWLNEVFVRRTASGHCRLIRESSGSLEAALHGHQSKLLRKIIGVDRRQS